LPSSTFVVSRPWRGAAHGAWGPIGLLAHGSSGRARLPGPLGPVAGPGGAMSPRPPRAPAVPVHSGGSATDSHRLPVDRTGTNLPEAARGCQQAFPPGRPEGRKIPSAPPGRPEGRRPAPGGRRKKTLRQRGACNIIPFDPIGDLNPVWNRSRSRQYGPAPEQARRSRQLSPGKPGCPPPQAGPWDYAPKMRFTLRTIKGKGGI
jgi:hypothetical protein